MDITVSVKQCVELINSQALPGIKFTQGLTAIKIAQIMQAARTVNDEYNPQRQNLVDEYASLGPTGEIETNPDGTLKFASATKRRTFEQKHRELLDGQTSVNVPRLTEDDLTADNMTPLAIFPLLPFMEHKPFE